MNSSFKFHRIAIYDSNNVFYASLPVHGSMTVDDINKILDALFCAMPITYTIHLE